MATNFEFNDVESDDETFNPAPAVESEEEDADNEPDTELNQSRTSDVGAARQAAQEDDDDDGGDDQTVQRTASREQSRRQSGAEDDEGEADGQEDANGEADAAGEDDEEGDKGRAGEEEDEDEEDEDEEDEDDAVGRPRKRHKRDARLQFIDVEAEVDEEEEEDDIEDEDLPDETHPDDLNELPAGAETDDRRHRELDRQRELAASMDAEKQAAALREKYGRNRAAAVDSVVVPQRLLLPSVDDPTIWAVRVKPGKEREVVFAIQKRIEDRMNSREPIAIISAFERGGTMSGYVYVEARKQADAMTALDGISNAYPRTKMLLISIPEMPDLLRTTRSKSLEPGMYVRIKRGTYAGDLGMVEDVETNGLEVAVRLVPRLNYGLNEDVNAPNTEKRKRPGGVSGNLAGPRPPQRLFSEAEAKKKHSKFLQQMSSMGRKHFQYLNETYIDGFLIKDFKIQALQTEDVNPTLDEVTKFAANAEDGSENIDLSQLAATLRASAAVSNYLPGDMVEVFQGEQQGVCGKAVSVRGDIVRIKVTEGPLKGQTIDAPTKTLRKMFREGDHVKVIGGSKYHDEVGMVVRVKDDRVTLLTDSNNQEITVFSKDLREASDSGGIIGASKYDLYDLVQLDASTVACVIKVDRESLRVLDQNGSVRTLLPSNISNKIERRRHAAATDRDGSEIRNDDTVKEFGGEQRQGRVLHIHRNFLFAQNRQQAENAGVFVVRSTNVTTVAAKGGRINNTGPDFTKMNPALQRNGGANGVTAMPPPKTMGRDKMIGKSVKVRKGPLKGMLGIVKDTTDTTARVEMHTKNKIVTMPKDNLVVVDPVTGQPVDMNRFSGRGRPDGMAGATPYGRGADPWQGGRTPGWAGGRTPAYGVQTGAKTPAWQSAGAGNKTPGWNRWGDGGRTVNPYADGSRTVNPYVDGSRTSYGGATSYGGSTWNPNAATPYNPNAGYSDSYSGSKTPAWSSGGAASGSKTPAWSANSYAAGSRTPAYAPTSTSAYTHPTPHNAPAPGAPTPSARYDAPTPGAYAAPTPGGPGIGADQPTPRYGGAYGATPAGAPTPGAYPETPGAYGAPTPAGFGEDDGMGGPRYD